MGDSGTTAREQSADAISLRQSQSLLVRCLAELIRYAYAKGYELTLGESYVQSPRKVEAVTEAKCPGCGLVHEVRFRGYALDRVHMPASLHHTRLALDLNLFVDGTYITNGDHAAWAALGAFWEQLHPRCSWGGRFQDSNHFSVTFGGKR